MANEIKEILDIIKKVSKAEVNSYNGLIETPPMKWEILLDYITKLKKIADERMQVILKIEQYLIDNGVDDEMLKLCDIYDVNGIELKKYINEIKGE